jgi:hypothetical protein
MAATNGPVELLPAGVSVAPGVALVAYQPPDVDSVLEQG